jgi:steroid 5-alpha reductase family enzyme
LLVALVSFVWSDGDGDHARRLLVLGLTAVWGIRLAAHIALRSRGNAGQVMDRGLWRYTRHPNYFGDACVWWGLWLIAAQAAPGALTVLSPAAMTFTLARGTGKPLLERTMATRRPGYVGYVERTSGFIPWPPKSASTTRG